MKIDLYENWIALCNSLNCESLARSSYLKIKEHYTESHRAYHNLDHIADCLYELSQSSVTIEDRSILELAIWFHDIIYKPRSRTNEIDSANLAIEFANSTNLSADRIDRLESLIINTSDHNCSEFIDNQIMIDIDLSILGRPRVEFMEYEAKIRREYHFVPIEIYQEKRKEILQSFVGRKTIYCTDYFKNKYEISARENLEFLFSNW